MCEGENEVAVVAAGNVNWLERRAGDTTVGGKWGRSGGSVNDCGEVEGIMKNGVKGDGCGEWCGEKAMGAVKFKRCGGELSVGRKG